MTDSSAALRKDNRRADQGRGGINGSSNTSDKTTRMGTGKASSDRNGGCNDEPPSGPRES